MGQQQAEKIEIRKFASAERRTVRAVFDAAFAPLRKVYRPMGDAAARQSARADEGTRLVAVRGTRIVGTVQFDVHTEHVHVIGLVVHPDWQRCGIARRLIEDVVARTPGLGREFVVLETIEKTGNVPLFERMGFEVFEYSAADVVRQ